MSRELLNQLREARLAASEKWDIPVKYEGEWFGNSSIQIGSTYEYYKQDAAFVELAANSTLAICEYVEGLEKALKFYANEKNHHTDSSGNDSQSIDFSIDLINEDGGSIARQALSSSGGEK